MTDANFKFDVTPQSLAAGAGTDRISANVYDAGSAVKPFAGFPSDEATLVVGAKITAGTGALSFRARFVSADNAALTTNPIILADTGTLLLSQGNGGTAGAALAIGDVLNFALAIKGQAVAKRYYGVMYTEGTADQTADVTSVITEAGGAQTMMPAKKLAVP